MSRFLWWLLLLPLWWLPPIPPETHTVYFPIVTQQVTEESLFFEARYQQKAGGTGWLSAETAELFGFQHCHTWRGVKRAQTCKGDVTIIPFVSCDRMPYDGYGTRGIDQLEVMQRHFISSYTGTLYAVNEPFIEGQCYGSVAQTAGRWVAVYLQYPDAELASPAYADVTLYHRQKEILAIHALTQALLAEEGIHWQGYEVLNIHCYDDLKPERCIEVASQLRAKIGAHPDIPIDATEIGSLRPERVAQMVWLFTNAEEIRRWFWWAPDPSPVPGPPPFNVETNLVDDAGVVSAVGRALLQLLERGHHE